MDEIEVIAATEGDESPRRGSIKIVGEAEDIRSFSLQLAQNPFVRNVLLEMPEVNCTVREVKGGVENGASSFQLVETFGTNDVSNLSSMKDDENEDENGNCDELRSLNLHEVFSQNEDSEQQQLKQIDCSVSRNRENEINKKLILITLIIILSPLLLLLYSLNAVTVVEYNNNETSTFAANFSSDDNDFASSVQQTFLPHTSTDDDIQFKSDAFLRSPNTSSRHQNSTE